MYKLQVRKGSNNYSVYGDSDSGALSFSSSICPSYGVTATPTSSSSSLDALDSTFSDTGDATGESSTCTGTKSAVSTLLLRYRYPQAATMSTAPRAVFHPTLSPSSATAKAVPHKGSVEKITVDSAASRVFIAMFSP
mmetsp:Transcript_33131/g.71631  ORF Transcript_33131/g.71631 Transcript_33131/m.71631 type:complete len:137 (-) Transcript_33131:1068-1478(-)